MDLPPHTMSGRFMLDVCFVIVDFVPSLVFFLRVLCAENWVNDQNIPKLAEFVGRWKIQADSCKAFSQVHSNRPRGVILE